MFYQTVVASCLFYAVVCWGGSIKKRDEMRLDKLVRRAGSVVGVKLDSVLKVAERRTLHKLVSIMDDDGHPLHIILMDRRSKFSGRLLSQSCSTDRLRKSFVPRAISFFNSSQQGRKRTRTLETGPCRFQRLLQRFWLFFNFFSESVEQVIGDYEI
ncbi:hypothetical protein NFI96_010384 [Prochilodus magdalenae]|nr:hypothetical protein NFI96_010384 [Prochilodus magdalenae]